MSHCAVAIQCVEFGIIEDNEEAYINLFDETLTVEEKRKKMLKLFNTESFTACMYCNGLCDDRKRFITAEQK